MPFQLYQMTNYINNTEYSSHHRDKKKLHKLYFPMGHFIFNTISRYKILCHLEEIVQGVYHKNSFVL